MPADASIFQNFLRAPKSVQDYDNEAMQAQSNALAMKTQQAQYNALAQQQQDDQALRNYLAGGANLDTPEGQAGLYRVAPKAAGGILKSKAEIAKENAAAGKDKALAAKAAQELIGVAIKNSRVNLEGVTTPEQYIAWHEANHKDPVLGPYLESRGVTVDQARARINKAIQTPDGFIQLINESKLGAEKAYENAMQGRTLAETVRHNTTSEGIMERNNIRSNERMSANAGGGAGGVANAGGAPAKPAKPLPVAALKMQQDSLDAIGTAGGINADLGAVLQQVESGSLQLGPVKNAVGSVRNTLGVSNENSQNLATFKATLEKLRNDSLRLNKGVQTDGDAQRAWNELLSNINDPGVVAKRLKEIRSLNSRAIELHNDNLRNIRSNYGAQPIDTTKRATQKPAIESAVKRINSDEEYNALPSGATFIAPDGKTRRKP